jgi:putative SOS response-associated peptidase YedK
VCGRFGASFQYRELNVQWNKQFVLSRRCLVPADGFYEWRIEGSHKVPMWFYLKSRKPFAFPGVWDCWLDRHTGSQLYSFTIHDPSQRPSAANPRPDACDL